VVGKDGVGPSGLYAAYVLRLSTQVPRLPEYAVPVRVPENLLGMIVRSRAARWKRRDAKLRPTEIALLKVLEGWRQHRADKNKASTRGVARGHDVTGDVANCGGDSKISLRFETGAIQRCLHMRLQP